MNDFVFFAFDVVAWISALLKSVLTAVAPNDTDLAAAILVAACLLVVRACMEFSAGGVSLRRCVAKAALPVLALYASVCIVTWAGDSRFRLTPEKMREYKGHASRYPLTTSQQKRMADANWWLICVDRTVGLPAIFLNDSRYKRTTVSGRVATAGGGRYLAKGRNLYFSTHDGSSPSSGRKYYVIVEPRWVGIVRGTLGWLLVLGVLVVTERAVFRPLVRVTAGLIREPWFLVPAACFMVLFGAHQWRFLHQDARMQMVTSRDDDGYMMARLVKSAEIGTMDPWRVQNNAYGAIGYCSFAVLPYVASHLGVPVSIEALNVFVRGMKLLISLAMLAAVWRLGARHLGRMPACTAVVLLALNMGFLAYTSFPFYPDVLMALFATLAIDSMLDLSRRWSARAFMLAMLFAALSVSVKFLTVLLFPFILLVALLSLLRARREQPQVIISDGVPSFVAAGVMCCAVFFLCNPYPDYNIEWITPNYKMCGSLYSAEAPNIVAGARANLAAWESSAYAYGLDRIDWYAAGLALFAALVMSAICLGSRAEDEKRSAANAAWLLAFVVAFQAHMLRSITLTAAIDHRILIPVYGLLYLVAAWGVVQAVTAVIARIKSRTVRAVVWAPVCVAMLWAIRPRLDNLVLFWRCFGRPPAVSAVSNWLHEADVPNDTTIATGLQTWFPASYKNVTDGLWDPKWLTNAFHALADRPAVYIEDHVYYDSYFSDEVAARGVHNETQKRLHDAGHELYNKLRRNQMPPYVLAARGEEVAATNALYPFSTGFSVYVDPAAFATDLAATAASNKDTGSLVWSVPVTTGVIHVTVRQKDAPPLFARLVGAGDNGVPVLLPPLGAAGGTSTERRLRLTTARNITGLDLVQADGSCYPSALIKKVNVHPPAPAGLNATRYYFQISDAFEPLIAWRPRSHAGVQVRTGGEKTIKLSPRVACEASGLTLVVDESQTGACSVRCSFAVTDGPPVEVEGKELRQTGPDCVSLWCDLPERKLIKDITLTLRATADITLRQITVDASEVAALNKR